MFKAVLAAGLALGSLFALIPHAWAEDDIHIGRSLPLTGPLAAYGLAKQDGGDALIDMVNQAGGINGHKISVTTLDDTYLPERTVANLNALATEHHVVAYLGLFGVPTVAAAIPVLTQLKIPAVGLTSGTAAVRNPFNPYVFPVRASYTDEARYIAGHISTMGLKKIAIIEQDNPFGAAVRSSVVDAMKAAGISDINIVKIDVAGKNAATVVADLAKAPPQAVFLAMLSNAAVPTVAALGTSLQGASLYAFSPVDATVLSRELGGKAAGLGISQIVPLPRNVDRRVVKKYLDALTHLGHGTPSFYGLEAFVEASVLVEGLKRTGKGEPTSDKLVHALETLHEFDVGDMYVNYTSTEHYGSHFVDLTLIGTRGQVMD